MSRVLVITMFLVAFPAWAQTEAEEAIILNQEMQVLEDYAKLAPSISTTPTPTESRSRSVGEKSLEEKYFGSEEDTVSNRASGLKRRSF